MRNKLRLGFLVIIGLFWVICIHTLLSSTELRDSFVHLNDYVFPTIIEMNQMNLQLNEVREVTLSYILLGEGPDERKASKEQLEQLYQAASQFAAKHLAHANVVGSKERKDAEELARLSEKLILASSDTTRLKDEGAEYRQLSKEIETNFEPVFWSLKGLLDELAAEHQEELLTARAMVSDRHNTVIRLVLLLGIIGTSVAMIIAVLVDRYLVRYLAERKKMEKALEKERHDLGERVKELDCLYSISNLVEKPDISLQEILEGTINLILPSWQYSEITCARIILEDHTFQTNNFRETAWKQTADIRVHGRQVGTLEVCYLEERPESYEGPFVKEERSLINAIVERLGRIIDHRNTDRELRIKEEAIASSINAIVLADVEGNLTYVNRSFLHMWGYDEDKEVIGKRVAELFQEEEKALKIMEALCKKKSWIGELVARRKDGSTFDVQLLVGLVRDKVGEAICIMASLVDITERKKIEQMKDDFVSLASHELRTPLTSIQGYTELILDGDAGKINREQREFLEIISQNTRRFEALINDVLDIEKIESGRIRLRRGKVNLNEIVETCIGTFKVMAEGKGLELRKEIKTSPINVLGDLDQLSQVLSNLLSNAIKYTREGGVKVTAQTIGRFASVVIEDTGVGMSEDELRSVFTRFFRSDDSYVRKTTGTGLGLSIAKATIERHDGHIKVESKLGVGSKFEIILPLLKEPAKAD